MDKMEDRKIFNIYALIILAGLIASFVSFYAFSYFDDDNLLEIPPQSFSDGKNDLSYRMLKHDEPRQAVFRTHIRDSALKKAGSGHYAILVYQLNCQAYSIYFNDIFIGSAGNMETGRSNIWNSMNCFFIDKSLLQPNNELKIEVNSLYNIGLSSLPIYISDISKLDKHIGRAKFFTEGVNLISIGMTVFSGIIIFMLFWISRPRRISYLYFSLALFFLTIFTLDHTYFSRLPFSYLLYKKLILLSLYLSIAAVSMGIYKFFRNKADKYIAIVTLTGILLIELFSKDMITFKSIYNYYNIIIIINTLSWLYTTFINIKKSEEAKMFFVGNILFFLFVLLEVYRTISGHSFSISSPFIYAFVFSMISVILFLSEHLYKEKQLYSVNMEKKQSFIASITDGMTDLYNRTYMMEMIQKATPPYSVAMLDIDNLKKINDSIGHRFGDAAICHVASYLKENIRNKDLVFRYGGDEFFIILFECTAESAKEIMLSIMHSITAHPPEMDGKPIPITLSGGVYYVEKWEDIKSILDKVDSSLYYSKNSGKNSISIYR